MTVDEVKNEYTMRDILRRYGLEPNRAGFIRCPFHNEKTASMKIYPKKFKCFGCGAGGDVIDFVSMMENCDFKTAFKELGGGYAPKSDLSRLKLYRAQKARELSEKQENRLKTALNASSAELEAYRHALDVLGEKSPLYAAALAQYEAARMRAESAEDDYDKFKKGGGGG